MSKYVRYTCNKKNEYTMREDCKNCPEYNPCGKGGKWCFVGALVAEAENNKACDDVVTINFGNRQSADILHGNIKKAFEKDIYKKQLQRFDIRR